MSAGPEHGAIVDERPAPGSAGHEAALEALAGERLLGTFLGGGWDFVTLLGPDGTITYVADAVERVIGRPAADVVGARIPDFAVPEDRALVEAVLDAALDAPGTRVSETARFRHADGSTRWVEFAAVMHDGPDLEGVVMHARDMTEQRAAIDELAALNAELEERVRARSAEIEDLYEHAPCGYHSVDREGRVIRMNATELAWLRRTREEVVGRPYVDLLAPDSQETFRRVAADFFGGTGGFRDVEYEFVRADGTTFPVLVSGTAVRGADGTVLHSRSSVFDNTARHEAEVELRTLARELDSFFTVSLELLAVGGTDGRFRRLNPRWEEVLGWSTQELIERPWLEFVHPDDVEATIAQAQTLYSGGDASEFENRMRRPDGSYRWLEWRVRMVGETVYGAARDVTEQHETEEALRATTEELDRFFTVALDLLCMASADGHFRRLNGQWEQTLGWTIDELTGANYLDYVHPDDVAGTLEAMQQLSGGAEVIGFENRYRCSDGSYRWIEWRSHPVGDVVYAAARDVTDRHDAEERLKRNRDELRETNEALGRALRAKDEFLASMSHELRTPLTGILGIAEVLRERIAGPLTDRQDESLRLLEESGHHLLDLINDVLDLAKVQSGQLELQVERVAAQDVCGQALQLVRGVAQKKRHHVSLLVEPVDLELDADPRRLKQMLVNLLSNAVKFTPEGGRIALEVHGDEAASVVRFTVADTGIGISEEQIALLFRPFSQIDSSLSRSQGGTGLGLSLVSRMADLHGGSVSVESTPGEGSRFSIHLPWSAEPELHAPQAHGDRPLERALTVEDDALDAGGLTRTLVSIGVANVVHPRGAGAVELAASVQPGIILLDLHLPDTSGWEVLAGLRADARTATIPVIVISADDAAAGARARGATGHLIKPFGSAELRRAIDRALGDAPPHPGPALVVGEEAGPLILVAEDNEITAGILSDLLRSRGYRVSIARDGVDAIARAEAEIPDVILMDIQMPRMDGLEATRALRDDPEGRFADTPIVALTALAMPGDRERCIAAGATEYVSKPVDLGSLARMLRRLIVAGRAG